MKPNIIISPDFNRFRDTLFLKKADRIPQFDFNIGGTIKERLLGHQVVSAQDEIDFWLQAGYDYIQIRITPQAVPPAEANINMVRQPASLKSSDGVLKTAEQLKTEIFEWTAAYKGSWDLTCSNLQKIRDMAKLLPESMKMMVIVADIFTRSWIAMGFENFCYALYEDPDLVAELFYQNYIAEQRQIDILFEEVGDKIGTVMFGDDLAYTEGLLLNADVFRQYLFPYVEKLLTLPKQRGLPVIYHSDGTLWEVFDDFHKLGINGIQPLEPKSMDLNELKAKQGDRFCLMGSMDIDLLARGRPAEVEAMVYEHIQALGQDGIFMAGVSNTVPDYVNFDNYITMIEAIRKYG